MPVEIESLSHNGVKGMHWGQRSNGSSKSDRAAVRNRKRIDRGEEKLFKTDGTGSAKTAIGLKISGHLIGAAGSAMTLKSLSKTGVLSGKKLKGLTIATGVLQGAAALQTIHDIRDIRAYEKSRQGGAK